MNELTPDMVHHRPAAGIPDDLIIWQDENCGNLAYTQAAQDLLNGSPVAFALCKRTGAGYGKVIIEQHTRFAMGKDGPRVCGENNDPDGAGSYALIASWYEYSRDAASIAVALALYLNTHHHELRPFRLKV